MVDRFRVFLPFKPQHGEEPYFCSKTDGADLYKYLKSYYNESDTVVLEKGRKFYPFTGEDKNLYKFYVNTDGNYISISSEDIRDFRQRHNNQAVSANERARRIQQGGIGNENNQTKYNVTTGVAYYSPTGLEYLMPDETIYAKLNGSGFEYIEFQKLKEFMEMKDLDNVVTYCNHCDDRNSDSPSARLYKDYRGFYLEECSHCKSEHDKSNSQESQYQWREYPVSNAMFSAGKKIYEMKILSPEHIGPNELSKEEWRSKPEADHAVQYLKKNRYFLVDNFTMNYKSQPGLESHIPQYDLNFSNNEINIEYPLTKNVIEDNDYINRYLDGVFGEYSDFIKNWMALYTYTNYETMPAIVLVGGRATGKNTFVEMVAKIYPQLWSHWNGDQEAFNDNYTKKLLWIDENAFGDKKSQYNEIKHITGNEWVRVNEKYKPKYRVRNNIKVIMTTNSMKPLAVKAEEAPTSEKDNNFFFYEMQAVEELKKNRNIKHELAERLGYYCRTELKTRFEEIVANPDPACRYIIPCPITEFGKEIYMSSKTELDHIALEIADVIRNNGNTHIKYGEIVIISNGMGHLRGRLTGKHIVTALQQAKVIGVEEERNAKTRLGYRILGNEPRETIDFDSRDTFELEMTK